jgi:glycosyltransferase involved in cell wall biosynthesis
MGLPSARNAGVNESQGKWVAFLDDDDEWLSDKLELQLQTAEQSKNRDPVVTCQVIGRSEAGDVVLPRRFPNSNESLSEYLFCRRSIFWGEVLLPFCTIFTTKELLVKEPFRTDLKRHEDLDWLLRVSEIEGVSIEPVPVSDPLVILHVEDNRSRMSNEPDWGYSLS